jgi:hypothetical protein
MYIVCMRERERERESTYFCMRERKSFVFPHIMSVNIKERKREIESSWAQEKKLKRVLYSMCCMHKTGIEMERERERESSESIPQQQQNKEGLETTPNPLSLHKYIQRTALTMPSHLHDT